MLFQHLQQQTVELGFEFYGPLLFMVLLILLAVPVWAALGIGSVVMLLATGALPVSLLGESLFDGIDHFALIAVPLFILTGDVLVRTGLSNNCSMWPTPRPAASGPGWAPLPFSAADFLPAFPDPMRRVPPPSAG